MGCGDNFKRFGLRKEWFDWFGVGIRDWWGLVDWRCFGGGGGRILVLRWRLIFWFFGVSV